MTSQLTEIKVQDTSQLLNQIKSNRKLVLTGSINYNLSNVNFDSNENVFYEKVFDGYEIVIQGINNLIITCEKDPCTLLVEPRYAFVLNFKNCSNIVIQNIIAGHTETGDCRGGVFLFENCNDIFINKSILFGCGTEGLNLFNVNNLKFTDSVIKECSLGIMTLFDSNNILFTHSNFYDNKDYDLISVYDCDMVEFLNCKIFNNKSIQTDYRDYSLFDINIKSKVYLNNSSVHNNQLQYLATIKDCLIIGENVSIKDNEIKKGNYKYNNEI